jgi:hypothetical protein
MLPIVENKSTQLDHLVNQLLANKNKLLASGDQNTKLSKNDVRTLGLSLAPHTSAGIGNICPHASPQCIASCLFGCGRGGAESVQAGRVARTLAFYRHRGWFLEKLERELSKQLAIADAAGEKLACRLNVFSDFPWESTGIIDQFSRIEFYDYSKNPRRFGALRPNYWVTFSRSETNDIDAIRILNSGGNVAVVFADRDRPYVGNRAKLQRLPKSWNGFSVLDGDKTDLRYLDTRGRKVGRVIGLRLKALSYADRLAAIEGGFPVLWN